ncbi:hypothetical protein [Paractinoplanes globisporus]|uniref:Uncharacterized protein n=1 Tax=Paractinoplanes globisporus TaxID=113565 RepID=A0ABW6WSH5_9ACTN|nr:hypothetical protein [Actinoplanes globisporus]
MSMRIGGAAGAQWESHIAGVHLRTDYQRLNADLQAGAPVQVIAADKAAVLESRRDAAGRRGLVDVTV